MPPTSLLRQRRMAAGVLLVLAACGRSDRDPTATVRHAGPGLHHPLVLEPAEAAPPVEQAEEILSLDVPENLTPWIVRADRSAVIPVPLGANKDPIRVLRLEGDKSMRVDIPGSFDPSTFNQVAVTVWCTKKEDFLVQLRRKGRIILKTSGRRVQGTRLPQTVLFDFPANGGEQESFSAISILFAGRSKIAGLVSVRLIQRPWLNWVPPLKDGGNLVSLGLEARHCVGLSSRYPLQASFDAPPDGRLSFAFGQPPSLCRDGPPARLTVTLSGAGDTSEEVFPLQIVGPQRWQTATLDLGPDGGPMTARFDLEGSTEAEAICVLGEVTLQQLGSAPPTVLLITSDTHRADYVGFSRSGVDVLTPFLDGFASGGVVFEDCVSSTNVTNPSHVALMTGTHPLETGIIDNHTPLALAAPTLAEAFRDAGYATWASVSAVHLGHENSGLGQGFERMAVPEELQRDSVETIADVARWLPDADGQPLFLWLHLFDVHAPYAPPQEWERRYYPEDMDPYDPAQPKLSHRVTPHWDREVRDLAYLEALYRSEVSYMDERLEALLTLPRFAEALVAFTSDHGESLDTHEVYWDHRELYPNTLNIPLVLAGPQVPSTPEGLRKKGPVRLIDLGRTLLDLAGLGESSFPGENLLESDEADPRFALSANGSSAAVMLRNWFFSLHLKEHRSNDALPPIPRHTVELYDLSRDPKCLADLSAGERERAGAMRDMLINWLGSGTRRDWAVARSSQDVQALDQLKALGYAGDDRNPDGREWIDAECACERCATFR